MSSEERLRRAEELLACLKQTGTQRNSAGKKQDSHEQNVITERFECVPSASCDWVTRICDNRNH